MHSNNNNDESNYILTLNFNTDGAPLTKSGKRAFWPLQVILNDLSPKLRFRFVLLGGILVVQKEASNKLLDLYVSEVMVQQMRKLNNKCVTVEKDGIKIVFKFCILSCLVDSMCRSIVQNRIKFNGYSGCSWCYQLGFYIALVSGIRYIVEQNADNKTTKNIKKIKKITNGVKVPCCLMKVDQFDMVWSFSYEYMHGMLLGVTHQLWNTWKSSASEYKLSKQQIEFIEKRFLNITPSNDIHRLPRSGIIKGTVKPKASELKSLPCLNEILSKDVLEHYALLVKSAYTLLKYEISEEELLQCEADLTRFVYLYEYFYGQESMTFNVHTLLHVVESVRKTGPLCVNSAFPFESNIFNLKTHVKGPKGMDRQMCRKHLQLFTFKTGKLNNVVTSEETKQYCITLFCNKRLSTFYEKNSEELTYFGRSYLRKINELDDCLSYKKCIFKGVVYHSIKYTSCKKTNDTVIQLISGEFARIIDILNVDHKCFLKISLFNVASDDPFTGVSHIKLIISEDTKTLTTPINNVQRKIIR
ncbi:hypothetical protein TSAR_005422, partial [Trichomalopsis sarcophagae]